MRFSLRFLLGACALLSVATSLAVFLTNYAAEAARRQRIEIELISNMRLVQSALAMYSDVHGELPPAVLTDEAARPLSSWRLRIARYITNLRGPIDFNLPWDSGVNARVARNSFSFYCVETGEAPGWCTNLFAITGPGTAFDVAHPIKFVDLPNDLIIVIDVLQSETHWMEPGDYEIAELCKGRGTLGGALRSVQPDLLHVLFADGEVWTLSANTPMACVCKFFTIDAARSHSREKTLEEFCLGKTP